MNIREPITAKLREVWGGYVDCSWSKYCCLLEAACFIEGSPYCKKHAVEIERLIDRR